MSDEQPALYGLLYILHEGDAPPACCPRYGAPKEKFVLVEASDQTKEKQTEGQEHM
jgi:hypothetical protein